MPHVVKSTIIEAPVDGLGGAARLQRPRPLASGGGQSAIERGQSSDKVGCVRRFPEDGSELREQLLTLPISTGFSYCLLDTPVPLFNYVAMCDCAGHRRRPHVLGLGIALLYAPGEEAEMTVMVGERSTRRASRRSAAMCRERDGRNRCRSASKTFASLAEAAWRWPRTAARAFSPAAPWYAGGQRGRSDRSPPSSARPIRAFREVGARRALRARRRRHHGGILRNGESRSCIPWRARSAARPCATMATVGGNLFAPAPYGDFAVALLALDATRRGGGRLWRSATTPLEDFSPTASACAPRGERCRSDGPRAGAFRFAKVGRVKPKGVVGALDRRACCRCGGRVKARASPTARWGRRRCGRRRSSARWKARTLDEAGDRRRGCGRRGRHSPAADAIASDWYRREILPVICAACSSADAKP